MPETGKYLKAAVRFFSYVKVNCNFVMVQFGVQICEFLPHNSVKGVKMYICLVEYEIKPHRKLNLGLKEIWLFREMLFFFTWRDIKVKYKQTVLGFLWAIIQPLMYMIIFSAAGK